MAELTVKHYGQDAAEVQKLLQNVYSLPGPEQTAKLRQVNLCTEKMINRLAESGKNCFRK